MDRLLIAVAIVAVVAAVAVVARRRGSDAPTSALQPTAQGNIPAQLDRRDFADPETPWLVAVFTSATCDACAEVVDKAAVLASAEVAVEVVEFQRDRRRHQRYEIEAVPLLVVADAAGVVRHHTVGPVNAAHLWADIAALRDPAE